MQINIDLQILYYILVDYVAAPVFCLKRNSGKRNIVLFLLCNWGTLHARLNSHCETKEEVDKDGKYIGIVFRKNPHIRCLLTLDLKHLSV